MIDKIINFSGFSIEHIEKNIIDDMISELNVLQELQSIPFDNSKIISDFSSLRNDEIEPSFDKNEILSNSKSKTKVGFSVNKLFD